MSLTLAAWRRERWFALSVVVVFLAVTIPVVLQHEMGRDELQEWLIARDTPSLAVLFQTTRYEGHTILWYLLLRPISRAVANPVWLQGIVLACAAAAVYLFACLAPFPRIVRALFAFGYVAVYGFSVLARPYAFELLLLIVIWAMLFRPKPHYWGAGILLMLVASTTVYASILVGALLLGLVVDALFTAGRSGAYMTRLRAIAPAVVLGGVGLVLAVMQVLPPEDAWFFGNGMATTGKAPIPLVARLTPIWQGYVPIPLLGRLEDLWVTNLLTDRSLKGTYLGVALSGVAVATLAVMMRRSVLAVTFFLSATAVLLVFSVFIYVGVVYHHAHFFVAAILGLWIVNACAPTARGAARGVGAWIDRHANTFVIGGLVLHVVGGGIRLVQEYRYPFSTASAVATYLRTHGLERRVVVVEPGIKSMGLVGYLGRPIYALDRRMYTTYTPLLPLAMDFEPADVLREMRTVCAGHPEGVILVTDQPLQSLQAVDPALRIRLLARFPNAIMNERFQVYEVALVQPNTVEQGTSAPL